MLDASVTRRLARSLSALWVTTLTSPEVRAEFDALGLGPGDRYFPARVAPLGAVPAPVVVATFFNFSPAAVGASIPSVWSKASPADILAAQTTGIDRALRRAFAHVDYATLNEAAKLLRTAADTAALRPEGRPLYAGYAALPWPRDPHLVCWHAHYCLREFRGDGHIAVLVEAGLTGLDALLLHIAQVPALHDIFRGSRGWRDAEWNAGVRRLRADGWLTDDSLLTLTEEGRERREAIERRTDELDAPAYERLGQDGCDRLIHLGGLLTEALTAAKLGADTLL